MKKILIINDRKDSADKLIRIVLDAGCIPILELGYNSSMLETKIKILLAQQNGKAPDAPNFSGTILDILFQNEPDGGIKLWESLTKDQQARAGKLAIVTNEANREVEEFSTAYAEGRCFAYTNPRLSALLGAHLFQ